MVSLKKYTARIRAAIRSKHIFVILIFIFAAYLIYKNLISSVFVKKKDRINVVFYSRNTMFYSLGFGNIDYYTFFPPQSEVLVPGGYGNYRIGALGKLAGLEKKPDIFRKTFSSATSSFVDLYFYPRVQDIYYDQNTPNKRLPSLREIFLYNSNANVLDKGLLWWYLIRKQIHQYKFIESDVAVNKPQNNIFDHDEFFKVYQGFFYKRSYRNEKLYVQILYTKSYKTAQLLSNILEGEGIHVVDLTQSEVNNRRCSIIYGKDIHRKSQTVRDLGRYFGCEVKKGTTDVSDIIFTLGDTEDNWAVK